ncbi:hypothetical protein GCM10027072_80260 [Streptomyces bullii]
MPRSHGPACARHLPSPVDKEKTGKRCLYPCSPGTGMGSPPVRTLSDPQVHLSDKSPSTRITRTEYLTHLPIGTEAG